MHTNETDTGGAMRLPLVLDLAAAEILLQTLQDASDTGRMLRLDASATETLTTPCIQIILAATKTAKNISIEKPSAAFLNAFRDLGLEWTSHRPEAAEPEEESATATAESPPMAEELTPAAKRILTIDDSKTMRDMLMLTLSDAGFDVIQAVDGQDGVEVLGDQRVDVVITDINMPKMDGYGVIRNLRSNPIHKTTPILVLTTESDTEKKNLAREAGATGWMVKPFDPERLISTVRKVSP